MSKLEHRFGDNAWTEEKLEIINKYINFYTIALDQQKWNLIYIDAFAGTGSREYDDDEGNTQSSPGSALRALSIKRPFDFYHFIEKDPAKAQELRRKLTAQAPHRGQVWEGDANAILPAIISTLRKDRHRGVVFLDPFAMAVEWKTLEAIAATKILDLWFLVPFGAIQRTLPYSGEIPSGWEARLTKIFGENPIPHLFKPDPQPCLFDGIEDLEELGIPQERKIRKGGSRTIARYILDRIGKPFAWVSRDVLVLRNSKKSPIFLLVYAISNPSEPAISLAKRGVGSILKKHREEGGDVERFDD